MNVTSITRALSKAGRTIKNVSPEIAIIGGTVGLITAAVLACKETPKALKIIEGHKEKSEIFDKALEEGVTNAGESYSEEDCKHDKALIFKQDGLQLAKIYAFPVILATLSVISIFAGGKIFRGRLTAATAAYGLLEKRFRQYRNDVIDKFGADVDKELRYKISNALVEEKKEDGTAEVKEIKKTEYDGYSDYARLFDQLNPNWHKDGRRNLNFLLDQQAYATDRLRHEGVLFLNDVYKMLGMERTPEGQLVGWVYDPSNPNIDNYVDFGISEILNNRSSFKEVMLDQERSFMLDFNCDGRILDEFTKHAVIPNRGRCSI